MPSFNSTEALQHRPRTRADPVRDPLGHDRRGGCGRGAEGGASDVVLKTNMGRIGLVVDRVLAETEREREEARRRPSARAWRSSCVRRRRWRRSASWPAASRTTSTTCSRSILGYAELLLARAGRRRPARADDVARDPQARRSGRARADPPAAGVQPPAGASSRAMLDLNDVVARLRDDARAADRRGHRARDSTLGRRARQRHAPTRARSSRCHEPRRQRARRDARRRHARRSRRANVELDEATRRAHAGHVPGRLRRARR